MVPGAAGGRLTALPAKDGDGAQDLSLIPPLRTRSLRDTAFYRIAVNAQRPLLTGFIENDFIRNPCRQKAGDAAGRTVLRVITEPVAGKILVDGREVGEGVWAAEEPPAPT